MHREKIQEELRQLHEQSQSRHGRKRKRGKKLKIIGAAAVGAILLGVFGGYLWLHSLESKMQMKPREREKIQKVVKAPEGAGINLLLAGTDRRPDWNSSRADSIVFIHADKESKKVYMLSIPRDTRVAIPGRGMDKINHSWAFGGAPLLIQTVSDFLGQPINYFFQVDFSRFEKAVNDMGGVDFASPASWYDGELGVEVRPGLQHRMGKEALAIVRNRHNGPGGGGDMVRVPVQQQFLQAMVAQSIKSYADVPKMAGIIASNVNTNMGMTEMMGTGRSFVGEGLEMETAILTGRGAMIGGISYAIPDLKAKDALMSAMLNNEPFPEQ